MVQKTEKGIFLEEFTEAQRKVFWKSTVRKNAFIYVGKLVYKNLAFPKPASQNVYYEHVR